MLEITRNEWEASRYFFFLKTNGGRTVQIAKNKKDQPRKNKKDQPDWLTMAEKGGENNRQ